MATSDVEIRVGVLLYTYDRVDDAKINEEIIRTVWPRAPLLERVPIVHAYNGEEAWWPERYLEDDLRRTENPGHFAGAELLLNTGIEVFGSMYPEVTHVVVLASDTWCVRPEYIERVVRTMQKDGKYLATCAWGNKTDTDMFRIGMALDFFVADMRFVRQSSFFPIRYQDFVERFSELLMYQDALPYLERVVAMRFKQSILKVSELPSENLLKSVARAHIYEMQEREPIHYRQRHLFKKPVGKRTMHWPAIGLITHHDAEEKRRVLRTYKLSGGAEMQRFLRANDLSYFNGGKRLTVFKKNGKNIGYHD